MRMPSATEYETICFESVFKMDLKGTIYYKRNNFQAFFFII